MQIEHKTEKGTLCFFLPPSEADRFKMFTDIGRPYLSYFVGVETCRHYVPDGTALIGLTSEVTDEQCKMMVDEIKGFRENMFKDYASDTILHHWCDTATDSFKSLMNFLQVYDVNPYDETNILLEAEYYLNVKARCGKWIVLFKPND